MRRGDGENTSARHDEPPGSDPKRATSRISPASHRGRKIVARCAGGDPLWHGVAQGRVRYERFWALLATVGGEAVCRRQAKLPDRRAELSSGPPRLPRHGRKVPRARCAASPTIRQRGFTNSCVALAITRDGSRCRVSPLPDPRCGGMIALDEQAETTMIGLEVPVEGVARRFFAWPGRLSGLAAGADQRVRTTSCSAVRKPAVIPASTSSP
jgi:hypothetical protein